MHWKYEKNISFFLLSMNIYTSHHDEEYSDESESFLED